MNANEPHRALEPTIIIQQTTRRYRHGPRTEARHQRRVTLRSREADVAHTQPSSHAPDEAIGARAAVSHQTVIAMICITAVTYAVVRYVFAKGVPLDQLPSYVINKAAALAALSLFAAAVMSRVRQRASIYGKLGVCLALLHSGLSVALLSPTYFGKLFGESGAMTWQGEASLLLGVAAIVGVLRAGKSRRAHAWILAGVGLHVACMGASGWIAVSTWPGGLPPITLLAVVVTVIALAMLGRRRVAS